VTFTKRRAGRRYQLTVAAARCPAAATPWQEAAVWHSAANVSSITWTADGEG